MMNNLKNLKAGRPDLVDGRMLYPLLRWSSGSQLDLESCSAINRYLFSVHSDIIKNWLSISLKDKNPYIKYPKATKEAEDKTFELKKTLVMEFFGWSVQELERNSEIFDYIDFSVVADSLGIDNKQRKLLGLAIIKPTKVTKKASKPIKSLFDFGGP